MTLLNWDPLEKRRCVHGSFQQKLILVLAIELLQHQLPEEKEITIAAKCSSSTMTRRNLFARPPGSELAKKVRIYGSDALNNSARKTNCERIAKWRGSAPHCNSLKYIQHCFAMNPKNIVHFSQQQPSPCREAQLLDLRLKKA